MLKNQMPAQATPHWPTFKMHDGRLARNNEEVTPIALSGASELELCAYLNEITVAVEMGRLHAGSDAVPQQFETADVFEKFLREMDVHYKRSLDSWGHAFQSVVKAADEIRRMAVPAN